MSAAKYPCFLMMWLMSTAGQDVNGFPPADQRSHAGAAAPWPQAVVPSGNTDASTKYSTNADEDGDADPVANTNDFDAEAAGPGGNTDAKEKSSATLKEDVDADVASDTDDTDPQAVAPGDTTDANSKTSAKANEDVYVDPAANADDSEVGEMESNHYEEEEFDKYSEDFQHDFVAVSDESDKVENFQAIDSDEDQHEEVQAAGLQAAGQKRNLRAFAHIAPSAYPRLEGVAFNWTDLREQALTHGANLQLNQFDFNLTDLAEKASTPPTELSAYKDYSPMWCGHGNRRELGRTASGKKCFVMCGYCAAVEWWESSEGCFVCMNPSLRRSYTDTDDGGYPPHVLTTRTFKQTCESFNCPDGYNKQHRTSATFKQDECCQATCAAGNYCSFSWVAVSSWSSRTSPSNSQCCQRTCGLFDCPHGYKKHNHASTTFQQDECCQKTCELFHCPDGYAKRRTDSTNVTRDGCCQPCPKSCVTCKDGTVAANGKEPGWGKNHSGVPLVFDRCTHYCSTLGYCGTSPLYRIGGVDCRSCDPTCSKDTGGTCWLWPCHASRNATCTDNRCLCGEGYCDDGNGVCVKTHEAHHTAGLDDISTKTESLMEADGSIAKTDSPMAFGFAFISVSFFSVGVVVMQRRRTERASALDAPLMNRA